MWYNSLAQSPRGNVIDSGDIKAVSECSQNDRQVRQSPTEVKATYRFHDFYNIFTDKFHNSALFFPA